MMARCGEVRIWRVEKAENGGNREKIKE